MKNVWVKSTVILSVLAKEISLPVQKLNDLQFYDICGYKKMVGQKSYPPPPRAVVGSGMDENQYPG
jgi:hypothetical protein